MREVTRLKKLEGEYKLRELIYEYNSLMKKYHDLDEAISRIEDGYSREVLEKEMETINDRMEEMGSTMVLVVEHPETPVLDTTDYDSEDPFS